MVFAPPGAVRGDDHTRARERGDLLRHAHLAGHDDAKSLLGEQRFDRGLVQQAAVRLFAARGVEQRALGIGRRGVFDLLSFNDLAVQF